MLSKTLKASLLALTLSATPALADGHASLKTQLAGFASCIDFPSSVDFQTKPMFCSNNVSSRLAYMINGQNLIGVREDSLKIQSLTIGGEDASATRSGKPAVQLGSFNKTTEDGQHLLVNVELPTVKFKDLGRTKLSASVDVLTSAQLLEPTQAVDLSQPFSVQMGPYTVTNQKSVGGAVTGMVMGGVSGQDKDNKAQFQVIGDLDALNKVELLVGDTVMDQRWSSWNENKKTVGFDKPSQDQVSIRIKYWDGLQQHTVKLAL